jgi:hypothetical protein
MSFKHKIPLICLLTLTTVSLPFLGYSLYVVFGTSKAVRSITVSLSDVRVDQNESRAYFSLIFRNPSNMGFHLLFLRAKVIFNDTALEQEAMRSFEVKPFELPPNEERSLTISLLLEDSASFSDGVWKLELVVVIKTLLPQRIRVSRSTNMLENRS